jgi:hypothetical protein
VPLGVVTPRGWRWWWHQRTDVPLRALSLGASLLGTTSSSLAFLGGSETSDPSARRGLRYLSFSDPPELPGAEALLAAPLPLSKELGAAAGPAQGARPAGWGPPAGTPRIWIPRRGPNRRSDEPPHRYRRGSAAWPGPPFAALDHHRASGCPGEYQGFRDKRLTSNPLHQEFQFLSGQISTRPALDPTDIIRACEPAAQARRTLQRHDPTLQEVADHMHGSQIAGCQGLDPVQYGQEL